MLHNISGLPGALGLTAMRESYLSQLAEESVPIVDLLPDSPAGISTVTPDREKAFHHGTPT
jgi:hypothetical protein